MTPLRAPGITGFLAVLLGFALLLAVAAGRYPVTMMQLLDALFAGPPDSNAERFGAQNLVWQLRGPRVLVAALVGAALAASGAAMQSVFRNPLAAPDLLGVSAGAALGAVLAILLGWPTGMLQAAAFAGGLAAVGLVWSLGRRLPLRDPMLGLVLAGIAIGSLLGALVSLAKLLVDPIGELPAITFWLLGSFAGIEASQLGWVAGAMLLGMLPLIALRWKADALALSDDEVRSLGIPLARLRLWLVLGATLLAAVSVAAAGIIGWVGLVVPHAARMLVGASFARLLPVSALLGALLMVAIDALSRSIAMTEVPPGVLTAVVGAPALFALMMRSRHV
jgi:iron complex transport system permease protein